MNPRFCFCVLVFVALLFFSGITHAKNNTDAVRGKPHIHTHTLGDLVKNSEILSMTVPLIALDAEGAHDAFSNVLLIDAEKGLFLANAHMTSAETFFEIITKKGTCAAYTRQGWIDWKRDLALFKTIRCGGLADMHGARFSAVRPRISQKITVQGYISEGFSKDGIKKVLPTHIRGMIENTQMGWGITLASMMDTMELRIRILEGKTIAKEKLHFLFEDYIFVEADSGEIDFKKGLSASPLLSEEKEVIGIISGAITRKALVIPARHIRQFLAQHPVE